jgi:hypothetical protein
MGLRRLGFGDAREPVGEISRVLGDGIRSSAEQHSKNNDVFQALVPISNDASIYQIYDIN